MADQQTSPPTKVTFQPLSTIWNETRPVEHIEYDGHDLGELPLYEYDNIKPGGFRLLHLLPGSGKEKLRFELKTASLADKPPYEAISYSWGEYPSCNIISNGKRIAVTKNGADALWHFRLPDETRVLWMDSVCINQKNKQEKSEQVTDMHKIYGGAQKTLAFAGNAARHDDNLFRFLAEVSSIIQTDIITQVQTTGLHERNARVKAVIDGEDDWVTWAYLYFCLQDIWDKSTDDHGLEDIWQPVARLNNDAARQRAKKIEFGLGVSLLKLCGRAYFQRCWISQELILSKRPMLYIGKHEMPWDVFAATIWIVSQHSTSIPGFNRSANLITQINARRGFRALGRKDDKVQFSVLQSSLTLCGLKAHKPIDRIYAMRNIGGAGDETIPVDYRQDAIQTYIQVGQSAISRSIPEVKAVSLSFMLNFLRYTAKHESEILPSWIPDFEALTVPDSQINALYGAFHASKEFKQFESAYLFPENSKVLILRGVVTDSISELSDVESPPLYGPGGVDIEDHELAEYQRNGRFNLTFTLPSWIDYFRMMSTEAKPSPHPQELIDHVFSKLRVQLSDTICRLKAARDFIGDRDDEETFWRAFSCEIDPRTNQFVMKDKPFPAIDNAFLDTAPSLAEPASWTHDHPITESLPIGTIIDAYHFLNNIGHWRGARFCRLESGRLAWVPTKARLTDRICLFGGACIFHVIRPDPKAERQWKIIGPAYVHGLMNGELAENTVAKEDDFLFIS